MSALVFALACKKQPIETQVSGQIFIVTEGALNIKLGLVNVFLVEEQEAAQFVRSRKSPVKTKLAELKLALESAEQEHRSAVSNSVNLSNTHPGRPAVIEQKIALVKSLQGGVARSEKELERQELMRAKMEEVVRLAKGNRNSLLAEISQKIVAEDLERQASADKLADEIGLKRRKIKMETQEAQNLATEYEAKHLLSAKLVTEAESKMESARTKLRKFPDAHEFVGELPPNARTNTMTDADGKFLISLPNSGKFALFAKSSRSLGKTSESYAWLVLCPTNTGQTAVILLSNHNQISGTDSSNLLRGELPANE